MSMAPGPQNVFIPDHAASGKLVVDFSRNPKSFALPNYTLYVPVKKTEGRYVVMNVETAGRILNTDGSDAYWPDGADAPTGLGNEEEFTWESFLTKRYAEPFRIGELTAEQASWDILASQSRYAVQRTMTRRTQAVINLVTTTANWPSGHTSAVSSISGVTGKWDLSTTARKDIARSLHHGAETIHKATLGAVKPEDLIVVMSPGCAKKIALSQEIVDMVKGSPAAKEEIEKTLSRANRYGLPSTLYGYKVEIEDTVKVTSRKGATKVASYVLGDSTPFMCSRPGGLDGVEGAPTFSTISVMFKEEMTVESKHDRDSRRHLGRVVQDFGTELTATIAGFSFTAAVN